MNLYINSLKNPYIIVTIVLIVIVVGIISYLDDKANKNNKKSFLGHCKLIMICVLSALIMLFGYIFIENSSFCKMKVSVAPATTAVPSTSIPDVDLSFTDNVLNGDPGF